MVLITQGKPFKKMKETHATCSNCGAAFTYNKNDVIATRYCKTKVTRCPWCGEDVEVCDEGQR